MWMNIVVDSETENLIAFLNTFKGKTVEELSDCTNYYTTSKSKNALLIKKIEEGFKGKEYFKTLSEINNLCTKTIPLVENGTAKEAMSFPYFNYESIVKESWDTSVTKNMFSKTFIFCPFQIKGSEIIFRGAFLWKMPDNILNGEIKKVWEKTKNIIVNGNIVKEDGAKLILNFPRESESKICHVRPHGRDSLDLAKLPKRDVTTNYIGLPKQCFWLNHGYVNDIIKQYSDSDITFIN